MKNKLLTISSIFLGSLIIVGITINAKGITISKLPNYKIDSLISIPELKLSGNSYVSDYKYVDVTGDNVKDNVILTGTKTNKDDTYFENLNIIMQNGKTKKFIKSSLGKYSGGYKPTIFVGDFNGDKVSDIFLKMPNGGSGGMISYELISLKDNKIINLFDQKKFNYGLEYDVQFKNGFKVDVNVKETNKIYSLDISSMKDAYIEFNLYNKEGKLMKKTSGMRNPLSDVEVKAAPDKYQLVSSQRVIGTSNSETLGYVKGTWDIQQDGIKLVNVEVVNH